MSCDKALTWRIVIVISAMLALNSCQARRSPIRASDYSDIPAYNREVPDSLPSVLESSWFSDSETKHAYDFAGRHKSLLAQLPCYCYCDRTMNHKSLLSCFHDDHAAACSICKREAIIAERELGRRKSVEQIRTVIMTSRYTDAGVP